MKITRSSGSTPVTSNSHERFPSFCPVTLKTMDQLVEHSLLRQFRTKAGESMLAKELDSQSSNPQVRFAPLVSGPIEELLLLQLATISFAIRS